MLLICFTPCVRSFNHRFSNKSTEIKLLKLSFFDTGIKNKQIKINVMLVLVKALRSPMWPQSYRLWTPVIDPYFFLYRLFNTA